MPRSSPAKEPSTGGVQEGERDAGRRRRRSLPRSLSRAALGVWVGAGAIGGAALMTGHWLELPRPAAASPTRAMAAGQPGPPRGATAAPWSVLHVLYASCRCSENVFAHLFERRPLPGARERIVLVSTEANVEPATTYRAKAIAAGFAVETVKPEELESRFGVEAAPLLVVADPSGRIRYAGGYTDRKQSLDLRDATIIADLMEGRTATELPLLGSAVSKRLQEALDPLRIEAR